MSLVKAAAPKSIPDSNHLFERNIMEPVHKKTVTRVSARTRPLYKASKGQIHIKKEQRKAAFILNFIKYKYVETGIIRNNKL